MHMVASVMYFQDTQKKPAGKFMYVKQQLIDSIQNGQSKVLINPNFMPVVHINPHFNKSFMSNQTIHVNPNILKSNGCQQVEKQEVSRSGVPSKAVVTTSMKVTLSPQKDANSTSKVLVSTPTKLVRIPKQKAENPRARRISIHTKYKIIRHPAGTKEALKRETDIKKLYYVKNRFRIDHRSPATESNQKSIARASLLSRRLRTTLRTKNVYVKCNSELNETQFVSINGILYRRSSKSLILTEKMKTKKLSVGRKPKEQLLTIRGQKYKLDSTHRTLTLLPKKNESVKPNFKSIYVGGITFKQKEPNVFVKINTQRKHMLLSQAKQRSIHTLTNKMKKSNIPCPFYRKFGKCRGKENGTCIRLHNPNQVSLCPKFLQGACINDMCLLSHKVSAEKMPTCKFFLEGLCSKDNCPYLHVKINAKAEICKDFLEGFCRKAAECDLRHQYLCPDFEKTGSCTKRKCPYPHGAVVRKRKFFKIVASKLQTRINYHEASSLKRSDQNHPVCDKKSNVFKSNKELRLDADIAEDTCEKALNVRYYDESKSSEIKEFTNVDKDHDEFEIVDLDSEQIDSGITPPLRKRPKVGNLPSFIPLLDEKLS